MKHLNIFFYIFFSIHFYAQEPVLKNFDTKTGLPSNEVYCLHEDKKGFIWICTDAGLLKYNGNYFKHFNSSNGLPDNTIFEVKEDSHGRIWFRSFSGKIGFILNDSIHVLACTTKIEEFIKDGIISSFAIDENKNLYLGKRNAESISFLKILPPYNNTDVTSIWHSKAVSAGIDIITVGTGDFVFSDSRIPPFSSDLYTINIFDQNHKLLIKNTVEIPKPSLFTRVFRYGNSLYLLVNNQLKQFDIRNRTCNDMLFKNTLITAVKLDSNEIIIGEIKKGISSLDPSSIHAFNNTLKGFTLTDAVKDYQNGYWFSTLEAGVFYMSSQKIKYSVPDTTSSSEITQLIKQNDSTLLIGYSNGEVLRSKTTYNERILNEKIYDGKASSTGAINCIYPIDNNTAIFSGNHTSIKYTFSNGKTVPIFMKNNLSFFCRNIMPYKNKLIGLRLSEIFIVDKADNFQIINTYKSDDRITSVAYDSIHDKLYVGGIRGLYDFHFQEKITKKNRLLDCRIEDIRFVSGTLVIATRALGLLIKNGEGFDTINEKKGIISNICNSLSIYKNTIWVTTNKGISKVMLTPKHSFSIYNYPLSNFMSASSVGRICFLKNKACFFSGSRVYYFDTLIKPGKARFYISSLTVNQQPYSIEQIPDLNYDQSNITINYEALFYDCSTISYRYKINNKRESWIYTNETNVNFPFLSPGEYQFIVEAKNKQGKWMRANTNLVFSIGKPFWLKAWFIIIEALFIALIVILVLRYRFNKLIKNERAKNELKIHMYELETKAVKAQMNPHFIFNSLNSIQQFILADDNTNAYKYLSKFSKLIRKLLESNTSDMISLEEEIDILKRYIEIESFRFEDVFNSHVVTNDNLKPSQLQIPHMLIQPFVENAIWHGLMHKKGNKALLIQFNYMDEKHLICTVEDNGVGRPKETKKHPVFEEKKSLAIEFIKQRLELINKTKNINCGFEIIDKKDDLGFSLGTLVKIIIPILNK